MQIATAWDAVRNAQDTEWSKTLCHSHELPFFGETWSDECWLLTLGVLWMARWALRCDLAQSPVQCPSASLRPWHVVMCHHGVRCIQTETQQMWLTCCNAFPLQLRCDASTHHEAEHEGNTTYRIEYSFERMCRSTSNEVRCTNDFVKFSSLKYSGRFR